MGFQSPMVCLVARIGVYTMSLMQSAFLLAGRLGGGMSNFTPTAEGGRGAQQVLGTF